MPVDKDADNKATTLGLKLAKPEPLASCPYMCKPPSYYNQDEQKLLEKADREIIL